MATARTVASGGGWQVRTSVAGPPDAPYEEQHDRFCTSTGDFAGYLVLRPAITNARHREIVADGKSRIIIGTRGDAARLARIKSAPSEYFDGAAGLERRNQSNATRSGNAGIHNIGCADMRYARVSALNIDPPQCLI
jgi:hypothetical protein